MSTLKSILNKYRKNRMLRRMHYYSDQQGIMQRYLREKENWDIHFYKSKKFILKSAESKNKGKVMVLGNGWLLDLPLADLSANFKEIILVDIIHPRQVLNKIKQFNNVVTINADISGGLIEYIYNTIRNDKNKKQKTLFKSAETFNFNLPNDIDFVISLNIMVQLHVILKDYIRQFNLLPEFELKTFEKEIQKTHLNMLPKGKSCLITDIEEEILSKDNQVIGVNPLIHLNLPEGNFTQQWQWKFDSKMTYREDAKTFFNTKAIDF
ncbi:hypothetical protein ACFLSE_01860 [Bacteroidota bacterium]